ncbi:type VI secretion system protein TssA [Agaribacter marinus]|uniref:ImpA N-terminal domain-containing protein n=1 Tax=Agaribacter marinus TaxID=1431249 RepID=A0AA37SXU9_9ALTE|nr:type VI secretion system protein TssA [Agaribacter marinus]GLR71893.1 hypothetical protein GCM10007852_28010 [Agaribacter marinus]
MDYLQAITNPISNDSKCGLNLEDDAGFQNFFFEAQGTPERFDGQNTTPAEPPDWRDIKKRSLEYLKSTKDLKLISILSQSVLNTEGFVPFETCLNGLASLVVDEWDTVYPSLDEDDGDPLERISALGHFNDSFITSSLKQMPLATSKVLGPLNLQKIDRAIAGEDEEALSESQVRGIFSEVDTEEKAKTLSAIADSVKHLSTISQAFVERAGNEYNVNFDKALEVLNHLVSTFERFGDVSVNVEQADEQVHAPQDDTSSSTSSTSEANSQAQGAAMQNSSFSTDGALSSRKDVEKCFAMILDYYAKYEPSSPVPILVHRANKLVHLDFLEIMKDIYPDAISTLKHLGGIEEQQVTPESSSTTDSSW